MGAVLGTLISRRISPLHAPVQSTSSDFVRMKRRIRAELGCGCAGLETGGVDWSRFSVVSWCR